MKIKLIVILLLFLSHNSKLFSQLTSRDTVEISRMVMDAISANENGDFATIELKMDSVIAFCLQKNDWYLAYFVGLAYKIDFASSNRKLNIYYQSILELKKKVEQYKSPLGERWMRAFFDTELRLGLYYFERGSFQRAEVIFDKLYDILNNNPNYEYAQLPTLLMYLASVNKNMGNYSKALVYIIECEQSFLNSDKEMFGNGFQSLIHKHTADIYALMGNHNLASSFYTKSVEILQDVPITGKNVRHRIINNINALAKFKIEENKLEQAVTLLNKSLAYHEGSDAKFNETYTLLGQAYIKGKVFEKAAYFFNKALEVQQYDTKNYQIADIYTWKAIMNTQLGNLISSLNFYQKALINLQDNFNSIKFCDNPTDFENVLAKKDLLKVFHQKAITLFRASKDEPTYLACAWQTIQLAIDLLDNIKLDNTSDVDKKRLLEGSYSIFEDAIKISLAQANEEGNQYAFRVAEKSKSTLLLAAVRNTQIRDFYIPDSLIDLEQQYKFELQTQQERNYENRQLNNSQSQINDETLAAQKKLNQLTTHIKKEYPKYFELRYNTTVVSVAEIQEKLTSNKAFIEYFIGQEKSYIFLILKDAPLQVLIIDHTATELKAVVQEFLYSIYLPHITTLDDSTDSLKAIYTKPYADKVYADRGFQLYELLLKPVINALSNKQQKLEIIPDGILNYLPFDALIQQEITPEMIGFYENRFDYQYIGRDFQTSYCYSATLKELMSNNDKLRQRGKNRLLVFHDEDFAAQTVSIKSIFPQYSFIKPFVNVLNEKANKEYLKQQSTNYKYLHFSVHGVINNERPAQSHLKLRKDANGDSLLYLRDIYSMNFPADMVFTSACNAGIGPLSKGEGLLSLARGFAYSGARSLITTLWTVKGGASNQLLTEFYKNIRGGAKKDKALFLAKKANLNTAAYAHPYYWAGFIPIGSMEAIERPISIWNIGLLGGLLLIGLFFYRRLKKTN